jgi:hypothetical protein
MYLNPGEPKKLDSVEKKNRKKWRNKVKIGKENFTMQTNSRGSFT